MYFNKCLLAAVILNGVFANMFDNDLYERVLDEEICHEQLQLLYTNETGILLQFYDAGIRVPRGLLDGNLADWGNYHQCLAIRHPTENSVIEGKYCSVHVPLQQNFDNLQHFINFPGFMPQFFELDQRTAIDIDKAYNNIKQELQVLTGARVEPDSTLASSVLSLGICIPKVCATKQVVDFIVANENLMDIQYAERYCRLPNDKPFSVADYVAMSLFSLIALLMILSTAYDLHHTMIQKKAPNEMKTLCCSFSVYTNTRRLLTFNCSADTINCIDGIRAIAMIWIIVLHTFSTSTSVISNPMATVQWITSMRSIWVIPASISVDTFFMLSGLLIVYTTAGKLSRRQFLTRIHLYYILRYLRLFPLLAAAVLVQASLLHHLLDGPNWHTVAGQVHDCRQYWWSPLIYLQNYLNPSNPCVGTTWYLCVDMQLHWIAPLVLVWVLGGRRTAWIALAAGLFLSLLAASLYNFLNNFPSFSMNIQPHERMIHYMQQYYINTLTRASPFFVGMIFGYILHLWRGNKIRLAPGIVFCFWTMCIASSSFVIFITNLIAQEHYDNQLLDNFLNSFMRPLWAAALGWTVVACFHGYGGPVNWFLSLSIWKLPSKLSYAMYLFHYPLMYVVQGSLVAPRYFTVANVIFAFFVNLALTIIVCLIITLAVDSPFSNLQKLIISTDRKPRTVNSNINNEGKSSH